MNKWRNLPLRNTVLILFHHRHLLNSWQGRRAKTDFILHYSFLYSMSDKFQPSSVPIYRSHLFLILGIFLVYFISLFHLLPAFQVQVLIWTGDSGSNPEGTHGDKFLVCQ
jgi:hypothetical protein